VQKVNAAIDEIMSVVQEKYRILSLPTSKMGTATRTKHQVLFFFIIIAFHRIASGGVC
jgi:hypothetical protein